MSGKTISNSETKIEALKLQSSAYGVTIPLVFGVTRISGNLLDYLGFEAVPHTDTQGGKGGGVRVQNTTYSYRANVVMGLCHGTISEVPRIWRGKRLYQGGWLPTQISTATETYTPPGTGSMAYTVANASAWLSVSQVTYTQSIEGEGGTSTYTAVAAQGSQYAAAAGVVTVLDDSLRGTALAITYQYASGTRAQTPMDQLGLTFKAGHVGQTAWSALPAGRDVPYSGLALVAGQGYDLGTGAQVENHMFELVAPMAYHLGPTVPDVDPALMLRAVLTQLQGGAGFPPSMLDDWADWSAYCRAAGVLVSPAMTEQASAAEIVRTAAQLTNAAPVWSGDRLKLVPLADEAATGNGATYTPNTTPAYDLDDESYTPASEGGSPISVKLKSAADRKNHWRVEFLNRSNQYNVEIAEAKDAADIDENGLRSADIVKAHWICTPEAARKVAQTLLQRALYINAEYTVPLPWHYALIEPADLLTLADSTLQMDRLPVRVTAIEENETGDLTVTAEDYPPGTASAATYPTQAGSGYTANYNADPGNVDTPEIFEAPYTLAVTGLEVYAAVRGLSSIWGGCQVWVSLDGTGYKQVGVIYGPSRYGTLDGAITSTATSLAVEGLGANAQLLAGSAADAAALQTLCYLGGATEEYVAYQGATLTGAGAYTLSSLVRGAHGTAAAAHADAAGFVRVDDRIAKSGALDPVLIGSTMYFKFTSFNIWGGGQQDLASVTAWPYTITGSMAGLQPVPGGAQTLVLTPPVATLQADANGLVASWAGTSTVATVVNADGSDDTAGWTFTKSDIGVVSTIAGNVVTVTGWGTSPGDVDQYWADVVFVARFNESLAEEKYNRQLAFISSQGAPAPVWHTSSDDTYISLGAANGALANNNWGIHTVEPHADLDCEAGDMCIEGRWILDAHPGRPRSLVMVFAEGLALPIYEIGWSENGSFRAGVRTGANTTSSIQGGTPNFTGVAYHLAMVRSGNVHTFYVNGVAVGSPVTTSYRHPNGPRRVAVAASFLAVNFGTNGYHDFLYGRVGWVRITRNTRGYTTAGFTPQANPPLGYLGQAGVDVTATKGSTVLSRRFEVIVSRAAQPGQGGISQTISAPTINVPAAWDGVVSGYAGANVTLGVLRNQVPITGLYTFSSVQPSGVSANISDAVLTVTSVSTAYTSGSIVVTAARPGYPNLTWAVPVVKSLAARPAQVASLDRPVITLAGDVNGGVASLAGAVTTATVLEGGTPATTGYSWTRSATSGITTSIAGAAVTITAIDAATDAGTITLTGTKDSWPTVVLQCQVNKTRQLPVAGAPVAQMQARTAYVGSSSAASAKVRFRTDGTAQVWDEVAAAWAASGNWYNPTTTGIGSSYYLRMTTSSPVSAATGSFNAWLQLNTDREFTLANPGGSGSNIVTALALISTSSTGATIGGQGSITLVAESFGS